MKCRMPNAECRINSTFNIHHSTFSSGFTLIEILVTMGIVGILSTLITQALFTTSRTNTKTELIKELKQNGDFALDVMTRMIRGADAIDQTSCDPGGTESPSVTITNFDRGITTFACLMDGTVARLASTSAGRTDYLTSSTATLGGVDCGVSSLQFICTGDGLGHTTVQIQFSLAQKGTPIATYEQASIKFQTSVTTRN